MDMTGIGAICYLCTSVYQFLQGRRKSLYEIRPFSFFSIRYLLLSLKSLISSYGTHYCWFLLGFFLPKQKQPLCDEVQIFLYSLCWKGVNGHLGLRTRPAAQHSMDTAGKPLMAFIVLPLSGHLTWVFELLPIWIPGTLGPPALVFTCGRQALRRKLATRVCPQKDNEGRKV